MDRLDDKQLYEQLDPQHMGKLIIGFADQCRAAWQNAARAQLPDEFRDAEEILILGMGGSAIGGDLLSALVVDECPIPITVWRDYQLPAWVNARTLVIASSNSGDTEETLSAFSQASPRGAMLLAITRGGKLAQLAKQAGAHVISFEFESQPRAALGYSFISLLAAVSRLGWIKDPAKDLEAALVGLAALDREIGPDAPAAQNSAKQLAVEFYGKLPVVYGAGLFGPVARRWKTQFNENAKTTAFYDSMSELNHNAVVGYEFPRDALAHVLFVLISSQSDRPAIRKRFEVTLDLLNRHGLASQIIDVPGPSALARMLWAVHLGDFASYYLAILNGVDPTPVAAIDYLKTQLAAQ